MCYFDPFILFYFHLQYFYRGSNDKTGPRPGDDTAVVLDVTTQILASLDFPYRCKVWCLSHRGFTVSVFLRSIGWSNIWCWYLLGQSSYREKLDSSPGGIKLFCFEGSGGGALTAEFYVITTLRLAVALSRETKSLHARV